MKGRKDQVSGECGVDTERCGLAVADLSDHDDVRVLAQEGTESHRKGESNLRLHLGLIDTRHLILDRVFDCGDVHVRCIQNIKQGIERRRLPASGRPRREDHPHVLPHRIMERF